MSETTCTVTGMTCEHCAQAVTTELSNVPGVTDVDVNLASGHVRVANVRPLDDAAVRAAVEDAGYAVTG